MKKIVLWGIVSLIIVGIAVSAFLWLRKPQVITLNDGTKLTLIGVTYGRHHVAPQIKIAGRVRRGGPRLDSTNNTLVVWIEAQHKVNQYASFDLLVYDQADTACVGTGTQIEQQIQRGVEIHGFRLDAYPRWDRKMILRVRSWRNGERVSGEKFVVANPARDKSYARWTPEPLPDTQSDGDLTVTLTKLAAEAPSPYNRARGVPRNDPVNKRVQVAFDVQQNGQSVTNWRPVRVVTSDAAGNSIREWINANYYQNGRPAGYNYQYGLWPNESAWKLRVEFARTSGFRADEMWSVADVPVQPGTQQEVWNNWGNSRQNKPAFAEATVNGIHLKLFPAIQFKSQNPGGEQTVSFTIRADPDPEAQGMRMTLLKVTDEEGRVLQNRSSSWGGGNYQYQFPSPHGAGALNIRLALQKSRFVEFTVKPQTAAQ